MDKELIERLVRKAGGKVEILGDAADRVGVCFEGSAPTQDRYPSLERFAALVAEECAKVADAAGAEHPEWRERGAVVCGKVAATIREKFSQPT